MNAKTKVLVIGFDSGDKDLVLSWAQEGALPSFRSLMERSFRVETENPQGLIASAVWPSFYTGASPAQHAIYEPHHMFDPQTYTERVCQPEDLTAEPFWTALGRADRRSVLIDVPYAFPTDDINGLQLLDWGTHAPMAHSEVTLHPDRFETRPPQLAGEIARRFEPDTIGTCDSLYIDGKADFTIFRDRLIERLNRKADLSVHLMEREPWDFFITVFSEAHCVGHQCWHFQDPNHPKHDPALAEQVGNPVKDVYMALDKATGRILDRVGPETTVLLLFSHGTAPCYTGTFLLDKILERLEGVKGPGFRSVGHSLQGMWQGFPGGVRRALRPMKHRLMPAIKTAMSGRRPSERSFFEVITNDAAGGIRLNVIGREANGRVDQADYDQVCSDLAKDLLQIVEVASGEPLVRNVIKTKETFEGRALAALPDLLVEWNRKHPIGPVRSPKIGTIDRWSPMVTRAGDHAPHGLLAASGPGIEPRRMNRRVPIYDVAPTIGRLLGVTIETNDGRPIPEIVSGRMAKR